MGAQKNDRPLVTFALFAYNQEQYIREAVQGAFSQTYSPLEIILSDDHSADRTFDIILEMAADYVGPHQVRVRRNEENLGIAGHVNMVMAQAAGELVVMAAGDDVSIPSRTERLLSLWLKEERKPDGLFSGYTAVSAGRSKTIKPTGNYSIDYCFHHTALNLLGATAAWTRRLWETWGPLPADSLCEDRNLSFRALLGGGLAYTPEAMVRYRSSAKPALSGDAQWLTRTLWRWKRELHFYDDYAKDLHAAGKMEKQAVDTDKLLNLLSQRKALLACDCQLLAGGRKDILRYCLRLLFNKAWLDASVRSRVYIVLILVRWCVLRTKDAPTLDTRNHRALRR